MAVTRSNDVIGWRKQRATDIANMAAILFWPDVKAKLISRNDKELGWLLR